VNIRFYAVLAGASLALLLTVPAMAAPAQHHAKAAHHFKHRSVRLRYDYRAADSVREEFADAPRGHWMRESREESRYDYRERREVVENLRGDFTGGVGYGADGGAGFVDGYGQTHFFVGSFRQMNRMPRGPFMPHRFAPSHGRGF
jgi:hypothetical protein